MQLLLNVDEKTLLALLACFLLLKVIPYISRKISDFNFKKKNGKGKSNPYISENANQDIELFQETLKETFSDLTSEEKAILNRSKLIAQELKSQEEIDKYERMFFSSKDDDSVEELTEEEIIKFSEKDEIAK